MKQVAKLIIIDPNDNYLLMQRSSHPVFGDDPDLPGGTLEDGEQPLQTMIREVDEEAGVTIRKEDAQKLYAGTEYSTHDTEYSLYQARLTTRPEITISWEHSGYEWLSRDEFLEKAKNSQDTYMHMVYDQLK